MGTFGPGILLDGHSRRPIAGKVIRVLDPVTDLPVETVETVVTDANGYYDQFRTTDITIEHVKLTDGRVKGVHVPAVGTALSEITGADIAELRDIKTAFDEGIDTTDAAVSAVVGQDSLTRDAIDTRVGQTLAFEVASGTALGNPTAASIQAAADAAKTSGKRLYAAGTLTTSTTLTLACDADLSGLTINYTGTGTAVIVGGLTVTFRKDVRLPHVVNGNKSGAGWAAGTVGVRAQNLNSCMLTVPRITGFDTGLLDYGSNGQGHVHNTYRLGDLYNNKRNHIITTDATGWSNSNLYLGGRFQHQSTEGTLVPGTRHIMIQTTNHVPNGNTWIGPSVEGVEVEFAIDVDSGQYNTFLNPRLEASHGPRIRWGSGAVGNTIVTGYQPSNAVVTRISGQSRNMIQGVNQFEVEGSSATAVQRLRNTASSANPVVGIYEPGVYDPTQWAWAFSADKITGRRPAEAFPRFEFDRVAGRMSLGPGSVAPFRIEPVGTSGLALLGGNLYFENNDTRDIGLATSFRPRDVNVARYVKIGTIYLRDNAGTLEKATSTAGPWTAV